MTEEANTPVKWTARALTPVEKSYFALVDDAPRRNFAVVNDVLGKLVALAPALAGGSAIFLSEPLVAAPARVVAALCFLGALVFTLCGLLPRREDVDPTSFQEVKRAKDRMLADKLWHLHAAVLLVFAGFGVILLGVVHRAIDPIPPAKEQKSVEVRHTKE